MTGCLTLDPVGDAGTGSGSGSGTGTTAASAAGGDGGAGSGSGATSGTNCVTDPTSGVTLCEQIDRCPGVDVDQGAFPGCGFRLQAASPYDLECGCGDALCPIGAPTSCTDAQQLLDQAQSSVDVCQQISEGSCLPLGGGDAGTSSSCDTSCELGCQGDPGCIQLCGC